MIKFLSILLLMLTLALSASATPIFLTTVNADGNANTNAVIMTPWPPNAPFYVYQVTNIVSGLSPLTNTPNSSGFFSNSVMPIVYTVRYANAQSVGFFANVTDTTNYLSLATYATNTPVASARYGTMFGVVTNWLGYTPATNTLAGLLSKLGFQPATNSFGCITNLLGGTPVIATYANVVAALGFTPVTNTYSALTNVFGFIPATNAGPIAVAQLPYVPQTNSTAAVASGLLFTNGLQVWLSYQTNGLMGVAWTNLPNGSFATTTNGQFFVLSNAVWLLK